MVVDDQTQHMLDKYVVFLGDTIMLKRNSPLWAKRCFNQLVMNLSKMNKVERNKNNGNSKAE